MAAKEKTAPAESVADAEATKPDAADPEAPQTPASPWDALRPPVAMANKVFDGNVKVNVLESVHAAIRERAEQSLAINAKAVAAKADSSAKRARVNYLWAVQPVTDKAMGEQFDKALAKYAKYRPSTGDIPFKADESPMGQVTCRTGVVSHYKLDAAGEPVSCGETDEGAFWGLRYSVRPLEQRGDANRLPGTA